ncbi:hypothetical protein QC763_0048300 [Podospora pseudopauciseta]|uniref:FAD-binding domain-containing protein n=1 Tax=Podospora pseudopauciseta TaxID=2093780 RepID=A0ABR0HF52_9PEZI|nr:hypothetical protein QC763_0048300 [Podospora pseudopauciseta]
MAARNTHHGSTRLAGPAVVHWYRINVGYISNRKWQSLSSDKLSPTVQDQPWNLPPMLRPRGAHLHSLQHPPPLGPIQNPHLQNRHIHLFCSWRRHQSPLLRRHLLHGNLHPRRRRNPQRSPQNHPLPFPPPITPSPLKTRYSLLWFSLPLLPTIPASSAFEVHSKNLCLQVLANEKSNVQFCFLYQLLPPDHSPSKKFTQSDIEAIISRPDVSSLPLGGSGLTVKDAWPLKSKCGITPLEEGILKPEWHFGNQMVLVGDAAHKVTPTIGQGLNMGLLDVVSLVNQVSEFVGSAGSSREKVLGGLDGAFRRYRAERLESVEEDYKRSGVVTRLTCWRDWRFKLFDRVVMPIPGVDVLLVNKVNSPIMARGLVFRGIRVEREPFEGRVKWKEKMPLLDETAHDEGLLGKRQW